ncbi:DUF1549 domain-containing protein [Alienimonas chondri]|uniref:EF-hand domain-containing protein n=1 Tax=Alienimonas chondri TaxID=2681879 RepID=A0ABX1VCW0_9PLAN|nr:DUF1549 domain-containing protein [Alienimonas chondri]NNJ25889.1 hypothetical protein [Alienimonas chondri]
MRPSLIPLGLLLTLATPVLTGPASAAEPSEAGRFGVEGAISAERSAAAVDKAVEAYLSDEALSPAPAANDDDLLRRLTLDVAGRLPTVEEQIAFAKQGGSDLDRRAAALDRLLQDPGYAANWSAYWRDVIFKRATDQRAARTDHVFETWMTEQLASGAGWDDIASDLMTATGPVGENGATGLIFAQAASGGEVAAESSRIFLGIQIQCAECHDHPYDRWQREDFHALAAYFPRIRLRRFDIPNTKTPNGQPRRSFEVVAVDAPGGDREQAEKAVKRLRDSLMRRFKFVDANKDGGLSVEELQNTPAKRRADRILQFADADGDKKLSLTEVRKLDVPPGLLTNSRAGEHLMPDLENPEEPGTLIDPRFFLTDQELKGGLPDDRRRQAAASLITHNEWFAKAAVNRVFTQLTGEGFYTPVDDIGPDRSVRLEKALIVLSEGFEANDYDLRWLIRAIALTDLYGRTIDSAAPEFVSARPIRLRAYQIFNSVAHVAGGGDYDRGLELMSGNGRNVRRRPTGYGTTPDNRPPASRLLEATFGYDPSTDREDLNGDIPQALALMNGQLTARLAAANGPLAKVLYENPSDVHAVRALYRLILVREPTDAEREVAVEHVGNASDRATGFEDLTWALLNGAEFLTRR